jgi:uncharacterized membrane protein
MCWLMLLATRFDFYLFQAVYNLNFIDFENLSQRHGDSWNLQIRIVTCGKRSCVIQSLRGIFKLFKLFKMWMIVSTGIYKVFSRSRTANLGIPIQVRCITKYIYYNYSHQNAALANTLK